ncbi:MAG: tol-pal system YbgF family protein [Candidatus Neomarinimicrobiota bacterium]
MLKPRKKITRKELKRDPLMEALYRLRHWWLVHNKRVSRYGGIALVVLVLVVLVTRWRASQNEKAAAAVGIAFVEFSQGNYNTVISQLSAYVDEYSGLKSFGNGLYLLARSELFMGDTTGAEEHYRRYLDDYGKDPLLKAGAQAGLGIIAEGQKRHAEAAESFKQASKSAPTASLKHQYAIYAGRNYLLAQQPEEALKLLQPFLDNNELDFQTRNEIQILVTSAEAMGELRQGV